MKISVKVTVPKKLFSDKDFVNEITDTLKNKSKPAMENLFKKTTEGWEKKPVFKNKLTKSANSISMEVYTNDDIYSLVNAGSPKHPIPARRGGFLRFQSGYRSSTTAGSLMSRPKSRFGSWSTRSFVMHKGFKPRKFDELVAKTYEPDFRSDVQEAINRAAKK